MQLQFYPSPKIKIKWVVFLLLSCVHLIASGQYTEFTNTKTFRADKLSMSNPIGLLGKFRLRYEHQENDWGLLIAGSLNYFGPVDDLGYQTYLEVRNYVTSGDQAKYYYGKIGRGNSTIEAEFLWTDGPFNYTFIGGGFGHTHDLRKNFFYEVNLGAKCCWGNADFRKHYAQSYYFKLFGVGAFMDMNFHIGMYLNRNTSKK